MSTERRPRRVRRLELALQLALSVCKRAAPNAVVDRLAEALWSRPTLFIQRKKSGPVQIAAQAPVKSAILQTCMEFEMSSRKADSALFLLVTRSSITPLVQGGGSV